MKTFLSIALLFITSVLFAQKPASKIAETTFFVDGACGMCQTRIENAAYIKGVKDVSWDKTAKSATVVYRTDKCSLPDIKKAIAEAGYDTDSVKADDAAYAKLPACCQYRTVEVH